MENIFSPTFGYRPQYIVGRNREVAEFMEGLAGAPGHPNRATFLLGQRGMGKTVLLLELAEQAKEKDFIAVRTTASEKMLDEIIEEIQISGERYIKERKMPIKTVSAGAFGFSIGLTFTEDIQNNYGFRTKLSLLCEVLTKHNKGVLFLIDEIRTNTAEMREFATTYQHLVGDGMNVAVVMAGLPNAISSVLNDEILTFLNRAHKVNLNPLKIADVSACYFEALSNLNIKFDAKTLNDAAQSTNGYPYLLQLIGYNMLKLLKDKTELTKAIVDLAIINSIHALKDDVFLPCLNPLSAEDKRFLNAMAKDNDESRILDIRNRLQVEKSHAQTYRRRLMESGLIHAPSRGMVAFSIPYLGQYLRGEI